MTATTRLRAEPNRHAPVVAVLVRGTRAELLNCTGQWCLINPAGLGQIGYVPRARLRQ